MTPEGHNELFPAIEAVLKEATEPLNCIQLFDLPQIREIAPSANRVSDYLGVLFRKGLVSRVASSGDSRSRARWSYLWRNKEVPAWRKVKEADTIEYRPKAILDRPNLYVAENGDLINIELPGFSITIKKTSK